jgi:hypothetical protein
MTGMEVAYELKLPVFFASSNVPQYIKEIETLKKIDLPICIQTNFNDPQLIAQEGIIVFFGNLYNSMSIIMCLKEILIKFLFQILYNSPSFMKSLYLLLLLSLVSCRYSEKPMETIHSGFIEEAGRYNMFKNNNRILIKECVDGSLFFGVTNRKGKLVYQQSMNRMFSNYHYWNLYVDREGNIWTYNSDLGTTEVVLFDAETQQYTVTDYCKTQLALPKEFANAMQSHNALDNCASVR